uniref:Uncharacterized protein n=1 Tax=Arundo donax TaxID=35708 RepID=A0A0A9D2I6_ARUDO
MYLTFSTDVFLFWATSHYPVQEQHMPPADKSYDNSDKRTFLHNTPQAGQETLLANV